MSIAFGFTGERLASLSDVRTILPGRPSITFAGLSDVRSILPD
jgi:hypothetical protein